MSILQIHGTADRTIQYGGGLNAGEAYPSAEATVAAWRRHNGCGEQADNSAAPLDLDFSRPGPETTVTAYAAGCRDATRVELWSIKDGSHIPTLTMGFASAVADYLYGRVSTS